jgi:hypothetical protein
MTDNREVGFFSQSIAVNLWDTGVAMRVSCTQKRKVFPYNKRTMDRAMGPF